MLDPLLLTMHVVFIDHCIYCLKFDLVENNETIFLPHSLVFKKFLVNESAPLLRMDFAVIT